jgi:hypothetical protein
VSGDPHMMFFVFICLSMKLSDGAERRSLKRIDSRCG